MRLPHLFLLTLITHTTLQAGFFPSTVQTRVASVSGDTITLNRSFPVNGMSGVIVHKYKNGQEAITKAVKQTAKSTVVPMRDSTLLHDSMPNIKTTVQKGDKVIGGYLYRNVLVIAPNSEVYNKITKRYRKHYVHPDLLATYLAKEGISNPSKEDLKLFAKKYRIGLIYVAGKAFSTLLDPHTGETVGKKSAESGLPTEPKLPFYSRFKALSGGLFAGSSNNYYGMAGALQ